MQCVTVHLTVNCNGLDTELLRSSNHSASYFPSKISLLKSIEMNRDNAAYLFAINILSNNGLLSDIRASELGPMNIFKSQCQASTLTRTFRKRAYSILRIDNMDLSFCMIEQTRGSSRYPTLRPFPGKWMGDSAPVRGC